MKESNENSQFNENSPFNENSQSNENTPLINLPQLIKTIISYYHEKNEKEKEKEKQKEKEKEKQKEIEKEKQNRIKIREYLERYRQRKASNESIGMALGFCCIMFLIPSITVFALSNCYETSGNITNSNINISNSTDFTDTYILSGKVEYNYTIQDRTYDGTSFNFFGRNVYFSEKSVKYQMEDYIKRFKIGNNITIFYTIYEPEGGRPYMCPNGSCYYQLKFYLAIPMLLISGGLFIALLVFNALEQRKYKREFISFMIEI
ncbi:MAG: hypothetical protein WD512_16265 [Candidatus Paceibacterota bacterium]